MSHPKSAHWVGAEGGDRFELILRKSDIQVAWVVAVALMTCGCRGGTGHRVMVNPTGASASVSIWEAGRRCLLDRGVI